MTVESTASRRRSCLFWFATIALSLLGSLTGIVIGGGVVWLRLANPPAPTSTTQVVVPTISVPTMIAVPSGSLRDAPARVARSIGPAVVTVVSELPSQQGFFGSYQPPPARGSGLIVDTRGYVVTNAHVIDGAEKLYVVLADGHNATASLIGTDFPFSDLAVLKLESGTYPAATLGNSDRLQQGDWVMTIGSALGDFRNSVTIGIVSGLGRSLNDGQVVMDDLIQTDAAINHGNSGGPLLDLDGQVVGINTAIIRGGADQAEGIGFAIPSNTVRYVVDELIANGRVSRPYLPFEYAAVTPRIAALYGLPVDYGLYVRRIVAGSSLERAGIQAGDIMLTIAGTRLDEQMPLLRVLARHRVGDIVPIEVLRGSGRLQVQVRLEELPQG